MSEQQLPKNIDTSAGLQSLFQNDLMLLVGRNDLGSSLNLSMIKVSSGGSLERSLSNDNVRLAYG